MIDGRIDHGDGNIPVVVYAAEQFSAPYLLGSYAHFRFRELQLLPFRRNYDSLAAVDNAVKPRGVKEYPVAGAVGIQLFLDSRGISAAAAAFFGARVKSRYCHRKDNDDYVLRVRMGKELYEAKRRIGKGYYGQNVKTRNEQKLANDYGKEYYTWINAMSPEERQHLELASKGISKTPAKERKPTMIGDIRRSIQTFVIDIVRLRQALWAAKIEEIPAEKITRVKLKKDNAKNVVSHISGSVWVAERLEEAYRTIDWLYRFEAESSQAIARIIQKPVRVRPMTDVPTGIKREMEETPLVNLSPAIAETRKKLGL